MGTNENLSDKEILVLGYARTGKSVAEFLVKQQANVTINDRGDLSQDPSVTLLLEDGVQIVDGGHPLELFDKYFDMIIKNPGIPYSIPFLQKAIEKNIPIYTDVELASRFSKASIIGITGSNGKTTTTSLLRELLTEREKGNAYLAGNIGIPTLDVIDQATKDDDIVMELSSFQLAGTEQFHAEIAVITNIYEAHLDYHRTREEYAKAKLKILANQTQDDQIVYRYDNAELHHWVKEFKGQLIPFSIEIIDEFVRSHGAYVEGEWIYFKEEQIIPLSDIQIPGSHNVENVLAAVAVAKIKGISNQEISNIVREYKGMRHRIQPVANVSGRSFYNDSKATNITATITALNSFKQPIRFIGGGLDRGNEFDELIPFLKNVSGAYLYGETKDKMAKAFKAAGVNSIEIFDDLVEATSKAYREARQGEVVLLSPSCASWDQYQNFEIRGDVYIDTIEQLLLEEPYTDE
ncbi:MAG: UDP-N-acetylmuramoyl-L-alanine--D-glutamate ligase [Ruoffia tabacinasalis]|uniref:UDP-N-acetylmuramoyl-L-alanine--D-glutamate ligase n=1 Tax=unclassified Ruoffia TaxID=2862149 RepID=UPI000EE572ED|nr:UDP-N-acetylmuramoyl-L-alanine--D-glutamate ligase [Aerococcaceae bacterium]